MWESWFVGQGCGLNIFNGTGEQVDIWLSTNGTTTRETLIPNIGTVHGGYHPAAHYVLRGTTNQGLVTIDVWLYEIASLTCGMSWQVSPS